MVKSGTRKNTIERLYAGFEDKTVSCGLHGSECAMSLRGKRHQKKALLSTGCGFANEQIFVSRLAG
jgi:hypothetical protein